MPENRQFLRLSKSLMVSYLPVKQLFRGGTRTTNISTGGICLPFFQRLELHSILDLEISLSTEERPIKATGEIVWIKTRNDVKFPFEVGIKFIKIEASLRDKLEKFIAKEGNDEVNLI